DVTDVRLVLLVVSVELLRAADHLLVARVDLDHVDLDDDGLVHRARDDDAAPLLAAAAFAVGLRQPDDRPTLCGALALGLRALPAKRPRDVLARPLLLHG